MIGIFCGLYLILTTEKINEFEKLEEEKDI